MRMILRVNNIQVSLSLSSSFYYLWDSRTTLTTTINAALREISDWGRRNTCVSFNVSKIRFIPVSLSLSKLPSDYSISFENGEITPLNSINILGLEISSNS